MRGLDPETLAVFDSWQWPEPDKLAACDLVLENAGGLAELKGEGGPAGGLGRGTVSGRATGSSRPGWTGCGPGWRMSFKEIRTL